MTELNTICDFMTAAPFDLSKVQALLTEHPDLLNIQYDWGAVIWRRGCKRARIWVIGRSLNTCWHQARR
jgi:hypothetical protein